MSDLTVPSNATVLAPPTPSAESSPTSASPVALPVWWLDPALRSRLVPSLAFGICAAVVAAGTLSLSVNSLDFLRLPLMMLLTAAQVAISLHARRRTGVVERGYVVLTILSLLATLLLVVWPTFIYGHEINGVIHRSLFTSLIMLALGLPALCNTLFWVLGGTPTAWDTSRYPMLLFPILLALFIYAALIAKLVSEGVSGPGWNIGEWWEIITTPYTRDLQSSERTAGMRNYLLGTLLLIAMTSAIATPIGIAAGVCMSEYEGWISTVVGFSTQMLRAISVFILGVLAFTIADWGQGYDVGTWQSDFFRGYYKDYQGFKTAAHGSFLTSALVLSLLVIPVIARSTVEGFRSVPREVREGSVALGATEGHGFLFLLMPWAIPNIITGMILGCAEAAGSVAVLLFVAGSGEFGVGPLQETTSLSFLVYFADPGRGFKPFVEVMGAYQFTAALLLLVITFGLSIIALVLKQKFGARYRGVANQ
jgi:ABC-type phosphate transport system permease subunit